MSEYIEREKVYEMLNDLGGCGAEPESWDDGWDKAINAAIKELEDIPAADVEPNKIDLKPCPFCGKTDALTEIYSELDKKKCGKHE